MNLQTILSELMSERDKPNRAISALEGVTNNSGKLRPSGTRRKAATLSGSTGKDRGYATRSLGEREGE